MNVSLASTTIKYLLFAFNFLFVITGIIILAVGATVKTVYNQYAYILDDQYFSLPNMLIATGSLIFFISFFGCCGAVKESWLMLNLFSALLVIVFIFEFSAGIAGYVLRNKTLEYLDTVLFNNLEKYQSDSHDIWDQIQYQFECCGVNTYSDWEKIFNSSDLPVSCCPAKSGTHGTFFCNAKKDISTISTANMTSTISIDTTPVTMAPTGTTSTSFKPTTQTTDPVTSTTSESTTQTTDAVTTTQSTNPKKKTPANNDNRSTTTPYQVGCKTVFGDYIKKHAVQIGGCALGLAILQVLGIAFSWYLARQLKNNYYST